MTDKGASQIPVRDFRSGTDDFDSWVKLFENAVKLAHKGVQAAELPELFKTWITLKLDHDARAKYDSVTKTAWDDIKKEFKELLVDPQAKYSWLACQSNIKWDGKECFHVLATRIKRAVDTYDPDCNKQQQYYFRFRRALPKDYRKAMDLSLGDTGQTIDEAVRIAFRVLLAKSDEGGSGDE